MEGVIVQEHKKYFGNYVLTDNFFRTFLLNIHKVTFCFLEKISYIYMHRTKNWKGITHKFKCYKFGIYPSDAFIENDF